MQYSGYFMRIKLYSLLLSACVNTGSGIYAQNPISHFSGHIYDEAYIGENLERVASPIGGIGAGMFCLEGTGAISHLSIRNNPDIFNEPAVFAAIAIKGKPGSARVLQGPVPDWKKFGQWGSARGAEGTTFGLARCREASFLARFPFGIVTLQDPELPVAMTLTGWSPFIPTDPDNSSLPLGGLEYRFTNTGNVAVDYIFSYNAKNFLALQDPRAPKDTSIGPNRILATTNGFILQQEGTAKSPDQQADFAVWTDDDDTKVDYCWFLGGWYDPLSMAWNKVEKGDTGSVASVDQDAPGASLYVYFRLKPGEQKIIRLHIAWYVPNSQLRLGMPISASTDTTVRDASVDLSSPYYKPWYSSRFADIRELVSFWTNQYDSLHQKTQLFTDAFYASTLPPEVLEAVAANLTILKSPTVLRQYDGRFWGWEGCNDNNGSCAGSCNHVWNYAQAVCHLFPSLERSIRETEFNEDMDANGHQNYRAALPIRPARHAYYFPAADGQLGGIMKVYREWRISGDSIWLRRLYPKVKTSLDYCIRTWDPNHKGALYEPHHNTYDIEFWGADGMCTGYLPGRFDGDGEAWLLLARGCKSLPRAPSKRKDSDGEGTIQRQLFYSKNPMDRFKGS
jgi:hypothetical protein